jgi:hypothetical protein
MPLQFILILVTILGFAAAIMVGMTVSETMRIEDYLRIGIVFSPLFVVGALAMRRYWLAVGMGMLPLMYTLPVRLIGSFGINIIIAMLIFSLVLGAYTFGHYRRQIVVNLPSMLMLVSFVFVVARILYDRPGSAMISETGGGRQAFTFLFGFFAFWAFSKISAESGWNPLATMRVALILFCVSFGHLMYQAIFEWGGGSVGYASKFLYSRQGQMISCVVLAWLLYRFQSKGFSGINFNLSMLLVIGAILASSALAANRSRPLFAIGAILTISYIYNVHRKALVYLGTGFIVGGLIILSLGVDQLPGNVRRTLSTVIPISEEDRRQIVLEDKVGGEMGWESEFRAAMYQLAWKKISENPLFGDGFGFSTEELVITAIFAQDMEGSLDRLSTAGGYHNSLLQLSVGAGVVAGLMAGAGMIWLCVLALRFSRNLREPEYKFMAAAFTGCLPPLMGQMLMNGGGNEFFMCCLNLGVLNGLMINDRLKEPPAEVVNDKAATEPETLTLSEIT